MIIKLSGADFSTSNIGTVDLRTAPNSTAQALLDVYGKTTWTLEQKLAIEDFLTSFNAASYKTKIKRLLMPILAPVTTSISGSTPKMLYDVASGTNLSMQYGGAYTAGQAQIVANGFTWVTFTQSNNNAMYFLQNLSGSLNYNNVHIGLYGQKLNASGSSAKWLSGTSLVDFNIDNTLASIGGTASSNKATGNFDSNTLYSRGLRIFSLNGTTMSGLSAGLPLASTSLVGTVSVTYTDTIALLNRYSTDNNLNTTISMITIGDALTQIETVAYNTIVESLMSKLWT